MVRFRPTSSRDWIGTLLRIAIVFAAVVLCAKIYEPLWIFLALGGLLYLIIWHTRSFGYCCGKCGHEFEINGLVNFISLHGASTDQDGFYGWKLLRCPKCCKFSRARVNKIG